jgi:hypothetical protein
MCPCARAKRPRARRTILQVKKRGCAPSHLFLYIQIKFQHNHDVNMDLFIDTACGSDQAKFVRQALNDVKLNGKKSGKSSREIAAAYKEHVELIESLRKDLKQSKSREKALVEQFTRKIEQLQRDSGLLPASFQVLATNTSFDGNDMPMDEMAETARMERSLRTIENIQQKSMLDEIQKEMSAKIAKLEEQTRNEIREKDMEIDRLKRVLVHRNRSEGMMPHEDSHNRKSNIAPGILSISDDSFESVPGMQSSLNQTSDSSSIDEFVQSISPLQRLRSRSSTSSPTHTMIDWKKLSAILTGSIVQNTHENEMDLSQEERKAMDLIHSLVDQLQETQIEVIESLKNELEMTSEELHKGEKKLGEILEEKDAEILDLKNVLDQTNDRLQKTCNLEGYLKMVSSGQKNTIEEYNELTERLRSLEEERDSLLATNAENEESISAIQRVLAALSAENEDMKQDYEAQIKTLTNENDLLKNRHDDSLSLSKIGNVLIEEHELTTLRAKASEVDEMKKKLDTAETANEDSRSTLEANASLIQNLQEQLRQLCADEMLITDQKNELEKLRSINVHLKQQNEELQVLSTSEEVSERENVIAELKREKDELHAKIIEMEKELDKAFDSSTANEVLTAAKYAHAREQKLEEELREIRKLLENAISSKSALKERLENQIQEVNKQKLEAESKLRNLRVEIIDMKEDKLTLKTKIKEAETSLERATRIMNLIQETSDSEGLMATGAIADLKAQLKEQQELLTQLLSKGDHDTCILVQRLSGKVHTIQCLLETGILGVAGNVAITKFDLSEDKTHKEYLLEQSLIFQRNENQRMLKKMNDLEAEIGTLTDQVFMLKSELELKSDKVSEKEEELSRLVLRLKEAESGYISDDGSDGSDDENEDNASKIDSDYLKELKSSKELAEKEAKEARENLANAKMIISSLEESNKKMNADLRSRLHDSNAAIVSLLDQNAKYEQEIQKLKAQQVGTASNQTIMNLDENDSDDFVNNGRNDAEGDNNDNDYIGDIDASFHDSDVDLEKEEIEFASDDALD